MKELFLEVTHLNNDYTGNGMYMALYLVALIFIALYDKENKNRIRILYPALMILSFIYVLGPIMNRYVIGIYDQYTGPRNFWPLFITIVAAYMMVRAIQEQPTKQKKYILLFFLIPLIFCSGVFKISNSMYHKADNLYRLPQYGIDMCKTVLEEKEEPKLLVPYEIAHIFRQYSTDILLLYGENATYGRIEQISGDIYDVCQEMDSTTPDVAFVLTVAKREKCDFVVFDMNYHELDANPEDYGYEYFMTIEHYDLYRNMGT